jgi:hypothetical protein
MYRPHGFERLTVTGTAVGVVLLICVILEVLDRITASPAMRKHVNDGSEKFFRERGSIWQAAAHAAGDFFGAIGSRWF